MKLLKTTPVDFVNVYDSIEDDVVYQISGRDIKQMIQEARYEIIDALPSSIYMKDQEGAIAACNQYVLDMFGYESREQIIGLKNKDFLPADIAEKIDAIDRKVFETGQECITEEWAKLKDTQEIQTFITTKRLIAGGRYLVGSSINIHALKKAHQKQELVVRQDLLEETQKRIKAEENREAATLASGIVAHDMKNHLTPVRMQTEFLKAIIDAIKDLIIDKIPAYHANILFKTPVQLLEQIDKIHEEILMIDTYNRDMLLDAEGATDKYFKTQYISKIAHEIGSFYEQKRYPIRLNIEHNFEFEGSNFFVFKILNNLVSNAYREIEEKGGGSIFLETEETLTHNILKVRDTAGGVTKKKVGEIFKAYKKGDVKGTGLGLSSAQMWMKKMKGRLEVKWLKGNFIEFLLIFPKI